jgi:3,4-dihydroxy 2-butanone 4-phosphate synthase / GTP cyclohydrolase II
MPFVSIPQAIDEIRAGRILVVVDDEDRENEGDLTIAAEKVTPEIVNFMATHGRGLICLALTPETCDALRLPLMSPVNTSNFGTAFCESIDARDGTTTGISAADRTCTILTAIRPDCRPGDWRGRATSFRCGRAKAACWCAPVRRKRRWIWRGWRG